MLREFCEFKKSFFKFCLIEKFTVLDLQFGGPELKSHPDYYGSLFVLGIPKFNSCSMFVI